VHDEPKHTGSAVQGDENRAFEKIHEALFYKVAKKEEQNTETGPSGSFVFSTSLGIVLDSLTGEFPHLPWDPGCRR
jgi:hypothetical protein